MSFPTGPQSYQPAQQSSGYDAYRHQFARSGGDARERLKYQRIAAAVLGLASYLSGYGPVLSGHGGAAWAIRFALFAGLLSALGLESEQTRKAVGALAAAGFLDALSVLISSSAQPGWALWAIVVLNGLQGLAALAALAQPDGAAAEHAAASAYEAYAGYYAQAAQYYGQYNRESAPDPLRQSGTARAAGPAHQQAAARQPQQQTTSAYGSYADYAADYGSSQFAPPPLPAQRAGNPATQAGLPSFGHASEQVDRQDANAGQVPRPTASQ